MSVFKKIINKEIPAHIVYEDDLVIAFLDIQQVTKGHTLVVPKVKYENIFEIPEDVFTHLMSVVQKVSNSINKAFHPRGLNLLNNNGMVAGQSVFHYHFHIIPRYHEEELKFVFNDSSNDLDLEEYKKRANAIREALL